MGWPLHMREVAVFDANAAALGIEVSDLMAAAGRALAERAWALAAGGHVLIMCGPGNNGGDGYAAALELENILEDAVAAHPEGSRRGVPKIDVRVLASHKRQKGEVALSFRERCSDVEVWTKDTKWKRPKLVVDCLLGAGAGGKPRGKIGGMVKWVRKHNPKQVLACDIPTGLGSELCLPADETVTFHSLKQGMDDPAVGEVTVAPLPWPSETIDCGPGDILRFPPFDDEAHKGERGRVLVIGGGPYHGAPLLAGTAAARSGCDLVHVAMPRDALERAEWPSHLIPERLPDDERLAERSPEFISELLESRRVDAVVIGPGLGRHAETDESVKEILEILVEADIPTVIDADALYSLPAGAWPADLRGVATPHKQELTIWMWKETPQSVLLAAEAGFEDPESCVIIRTGAVDQLHGFEGRRCDCRGGHPRMATGGTGDLLAGIIAGLLAQGMSPWPAARLGCHILRRAGAAAAEEHGPGMLASDVPVHISKQLMLLLNEIG